MIWYFKAVHHFWLNFYTPARQFSLVLTKCLCCQQFTSFDILIFTEWAEGRCSLDSKHTLIYLWKEKTCKLWNVPLKQVQSITPRWRHFNNMKCSSRWILHLKKRNSAFISLWTILLPFFSPEPFFPFCQMDREDKTDPMMDIEIWKPDCGASPLPSPPLPLPLLPGCLFCLLSISRLKLMI